MEIAIEPSGGGATIGTLFQQIVNDMKNSSPLWEDFIAKATKLHTCLRAVIQALAAYLEAFQKIADAATNSKGATKEIGTALTRVCLRHKAVETRMKTFTAAIMECLIVPLQEKLEDWRKQVAIIDKDHTKEYKRCRTELKKRSSDTLRLQKKAKKGQTDNLHILVESSMQDVTLRRSELEEVERKSLRAIMVEERSRYCTFVNMLQPVVHDECEVMSELSHLQEAMQIIAVVTKDPSILPQASEELILDAKTNITLYPDSPGGSNSQGGCSNSLGSRKSSVCSISSINSSSSGSPGHQFQRSLSQASTLAGQSHAISTWPPHTQDGTASTDRPHTISSAYEKGHQRPALTVYTFQNPETIAENQKSPANISCRPPLPVRCSSLERPLSTASIKNSVSNVPRQCPSPIPAHITKEHPQLQPTYVNMTELASMAASKITNNNNNNATNLPQTSAQTPPLQPQLMGYQQLQQPNSPALSSASSLISPDSSATNAISSPDVSACSTQTPQNTPQTGSPQTPVYSCSSMIMVESGAISSSGEGASASNGNGSGLVLTTLDGTGSESNNDYNLQSSSATQDFDSNSSDPSNTNKPSPSTTDKDILKCSGSVLEKTSMFEQQINNQQHQPPRNENIYGRKSEEIYRPTGILTPQRESDRIDKETIEELNNLIGELDLFQKEHEFRLEESYQDQNVLLENSINSSTNIANGNFSSNNSDSAGSERQDKISISSSMNIDGLNLSLNSNSVNSEHPFEYSDSSTTKLNMNDHLMNTDSIDYSHAGFENPSFMHLNDSEIIVVRPNNFGNVDMENYSKNMSEVVVLRCKDGAKVDSNKIEETINSENQQRLSSFKLNSRCASPALSTFASRSPTPSFSMPHSSATTPTMPSPQHSNAFGGNNNNHMISHHHLQHPLNGNEKCSLISMPSDERINRIKPAITPRPASLSGVARVTRRSSVNTIKPPPPVRRSSSVTPSPNLVTNASNLSQQSLVYTSSESLPPPPAYLLDSTAGNTLIPGNVAGTVKALNEIQHKPASPSLLRRAQQNMPSQHQSPSHYASNAQIATPKHDSHTPYSTQSPTGSFYSAEDSPPMTRGAKTSPHQQGIYAQPKQITNMSSFRTSSPGPQKQNSEFLAQLNAKIAPSKPQSHSSPHHYSQQQHQQSFTYTTAPSNEQIYQRSNLVDQRSSYTNNNSGNERHQASSHGGGIYASSSQQITANNHQQLQQHQQYYHQQQQGSAHSQKDGKNQIYSPTHSQQQQQYYHQQQQQHQHQQQQAPAVPCYYQAQPPQNYAAQNIYISTNPFATGSSVHAAASSSNSSSYSPSSFGKSVAPPREMSLPAASASSNSSNPGGSSNLTTGQSNSHHGGSNSRSNHQTRSSNAGNANNVLAKTSAGFLENLNARLAEQRLSGKAFAVRNLINSKALPDPRLCHESLMDQIKRGATLKRNRTINDRSAPKIH
ncbi:probable serine/threonine-protein kinase DDB_G0282963 isoform X3 [Uranotaenia lowii]|uniref:probable serine/threonine-protein kinase DDB_G0282963 isoform X3 n=1 Tax=Uranotaenia lowii TaxID=190385 RepID=UPI002478F5EE|nr:probable serine/threonine-protein kinase DDB_G0282963 isoform X3 [Uranotaenia lowii]